MKDLEKHIDFEKVVAELSKKLSTGQPLTSKDGVFTPLLERGIEANLEGEMYSHLEQSGKKEKNRRNERGRKNISSSLGGFDIFRRATAIVFFSPRLLKKDNEVLQVTSMLKFSNPTIWILKIIV